MRDSVDGDVVETDRVEHRSVQRAPWSPAQLVALLIGGLLVVMGGIALANTGINFADLTGSRTEVMGLSHTAALAAIELVLGLILVAAGAVPGAPRGTMTFAGVLMLGFGIVIIAQPSLFEGTLGTTSANGTFMVVSGVILLLAAMLAPTNFGRDAGGTARAARTVDRTQVHTR